MGKQLMILLILDASSNDIDFIGYLLIFSRINLLCMCMLTCMFFIHEVIHLLLMHYFLVKDAKIAIIYKY